VAFFWSVSCTGCGFLQKAGLDAHCLYYWLGEDRFAPMPVAAAWCECCDKLTLAEEVPDPTELKERGEWWLRFFRERGSCPGQEFYDRKCREFANQVAWRSARTSPPRCLLCRSSSVLLLPLSGPSPLQLPHPGCRGQLRFERGYHYHTRAMLVYSAEGDFLGFGSRTCTFQAPEQTLPTSESGLWWFIDFRG
jgi:hypothetical protein